MVAKSSIALEIRTQKILYRKELFANCVAKKLYGKCMTFIPEVSTAKNGQFYLPER